MADHKPHDTYRSADGRQRATYRPDWDSVRPWITYTNGTARAHFATLEAARTYLRDTLPNFTKG